MVDTTPSDQPGDSRVTVVGAGTMGRNIAIATAIGGRNAALFDIDDDALADAEAEIGSTLQTLADRSVTDTSDPTTLHDRITYMSDLESAVDETPLVIEAVTEDREVKAAVYEDIERHAPASATLASNTSSLSITELAESVSRPDRFCGMHWFHPAHIVPVVEVVYGEQTADQTVDSATDYLDSINKDPVMVERDVPGFIANRIQSALAREVWSLVEAGVASPEDIDRAVKGTFGFRLPTLGVLEKIDHGGLDIHRKVLSELLSEIDERPEPPDVLSDLVSEGRLGVKSERGVYDWSETDLEAVLAERDQRLLEQLEVYRAASEPPKLSGEESLTNEN